MTRFNSIVPDVEKLVFEPLSARKPVAGKVCRIDRVLVVVTDKGRIYSSQVAHRFFYTRGTGMFRETFEALHRLGRITKAQADAHLADVQAIRDAQNKDHMASTISRYAEELGMKPTNAQQGKLARLQKDGKK